MVVLVPRACTDADTLVPSACTDMAVLVPGECAFLNDNKWMTTPYQVLLQYCQYCTCCTLTLLHIASYAPRLLLRDSSYGAATWLRNAQYVDVAPFVPAGIRLGGPVAANCGRADQGLRLIPLDVTYSLVCLGTKTSE
eukprot:3320552-Rhodomonas_salina.1